MRAFLIEQGYVVLREAFDPTALAQEFDATMRDGIIPGAPAIAGSAGNQFHYVPMMCERTPVSLALLSRFSAIATELLDGAVLPGRAKATRYVGSTRWHRDGELPVQSLGFACYLEPLRPDEGALQIVPGSHRLGATADPATAIALATAPGDVIVFDEKLLHSSAGGTVRRQWRVDFVADRPELDDPLRAWYAGQYSPGWDGGYDVDRFPSYGPHWRRTIDARWNQRLSALGAYQAADAEESVVRARRATKG
jgi:ectoine hydroxylase-related dioxygenase (phytanoyl-CoA dioxygenase family)